MLLALALFLTGPRQTFDLDAGWQYARVPQAPSIWKGGDMVPTAGWKVIGVSSEETSAEKANAARAFDGDPKTFWHSEWSKRQAPFPHSISIDLGTPTEAVGIRILPRQTPPQNGRPKHFKLYLDDHQVLDGAMPDSTAMFEARFSRTRARTLRLDFLDGQKNEPFLAIAEIGLIRPSRQGNDFASQYNVAQVLTGDAKYDPSAADLNRIMPVELKMIRNWSPATMPQPACVRPLNDPTIWQGVAYFRRRIPAIPAGKRAVLSLQGMQSTDVWLDGKLVASRRGGYMPLRAAIDHGGELLVRVDNEDNPLIPPGKPQSQMDFMYGNGIVSNVGLEVTDKLHIADRDDPQGNTWVDRSIAHIRVVNESNRARHFKLRTSLGNGVGSVAGNGAVEVSVPLRMQNPRLWSPDSPNLYDLSTELIEDGKVIDRQSTTFGIRTIEVSRKHGFVLNGKPIHLVGTNRHQDYPWIGPAMSEAAERRDAMLIKRAGHNIVRLSHYDQSPAFLDECDRLGVMTIPCIPGWQFINKDPRFAARVLRDIRETIRRDRRHPSVAFWEMSLNETYPPASLAKTWHDVAKQEGAELAAGDEGKNAPWEITYNSWRDDLSRPSNSDKPGYIREYGDYEFGGGNSTSRVRIGEGMDKLLNETWNHVWSLNKFRPQYPWTMGEGTWEMFDHNVPWDFAVSASGLADIMRREKPSFWFFASQESKKPYLKIAATWQPGRATRRVVVFTNAASVSVFVNGKRIATKRADRGPETGYDLTKQFDGSNTGNLRHPPIVFDDVPFSPGVLRVVGDNGAGDIVRTAGKPARLKVWVDNLGIPVTANDTVFVRAAVVDANGVVCPDESRQIHFSGPRFAGEDHAPCEMGVASVLIRTPMHRGAIRVHAEANGLNGDLFEQF